MHVTFIDPKYSQRGNPSIAKYRRRENIVSQSKLIRKFEGRNNQ